MTYFILIHKATSCQLSHFCNMNLSITGFLYLLITLLSNPFSKEGIREHTCRLTFLVLIIKSDDV